MTKSEKAQTNEAGVTLVELVIVVMILGIVVTAIFGAMNSLTATERRAQNRVAAQEDLRGALVEIARDLRSAQLLDPPASTSAAAYAVSFTRADGAHTRWRLDTGAKRLFREQETTFGSGTWTTVRTYRNIRNGDDSTPLFRYYGAGNQRLESSPTLTDLAACTLRMRLALKSAPADVANPYSATLDVGLRNRGSRGVTGC